jgi:Helix-turn-helix domain
VSVQAMSWVIEKSKSKGNAFIVLLMIANHAKSDGTGAWPSISTLAKECRNVERTVQRCILSLIKGGELKVRFGKGPYGTNLYEISGMTRCHPRVTSAREEVTFTTENMSQMSPKPLSLTVLTDKERMDILLRAIKETEQDKSKNKRSADERKNQYLEEAVARKLEMSTQ